MTHIEAHRDPRRKIKGVSEESKLDHYPLIAATIGGYLGMAGTLVCLAISHGPETMAAIEGSGGLFEGFPGAPVLLLIVALISGTAGAIAGRVAAALYGWSSANTNSA